MRVNLFDILSKTQEELMQYVICRLEERGYSQKLHFNESYIFAEGKIPVLLVAHLDTVHKELPKIFYDRKKGVIWSPQGIGGDDRCGVYAILKIIEQYKPYVLFTTDEEVGGIGADEFCKDISSEIFLPINFAIEIDRRGFNQAVFYDCGNKDFQDFILEYGFTKEWGTFSDISVISPTFNIASVNLSAGYYNEHSKYEYIVLEDLQHTIEMTKKILTDKRTNNYYDFQEVNFADWKNKYYNNKKDDKDIPIEEEDYFDDDWREFG